jgi:hypothetical protein
MTIQFKLGRVEVKIDLLSVLKTLVFVWSLLS